MTAPYPRLALDKALAQADANLGQSLERFYDLLRIKSISTEPAYRDDCRRAAQWLSDELIALGFDASVRPTPGQPMVLGHDRSAGGAHVLFYGHYDVQPVDPLHEWATDPFEPTLMPAANGETHIVARGASDDKGQLLTFVEACRAWKEANGNLPLSVSILLEGEEEAGSKSLGPFLDETASELKADVVLVCDTDMWDDVTPAVTFMMRGLCGLEVEISAASRDLHSGVYGGAARNPLQVLTTILASLRDDEGRILLDGFYDGVEELSPDVIAQWDRLAFDGDAFLNKVGLSTPAGESGRGVLEQIWARPTFEINGITGGYAGEGFKTVIPAKASAKVSFRLVGQQDPKAVCAAFKAHVEARLPADCSATVTIHSASSATHVRTGTPHLAKTLRALSEEWETDAALSGNGGSIPVINEFRDRLGMDALLVGFARFDNRVHSPNEKYDMSSFTKGIRSWLRILDKLADGHSGA
ncbi:M20/M25/M40 family metallo-hydrolase [Bosea lathyri]|uniref:Acetylornithine deacetylase/Succinyl-diaminopimelate desuccinylase n=1 Tax=Bosea lathyri TaxID=1036778 RepID=A0A1H6C8Q8_9HYPH|nr:M20/M25/M40 family metallo-hydrolase [Bosea lathyri]SEG69341.1 Acetylornithine deacetylase/Succinyl-diaminopimelate desuccinylase [Bosea lathyri]